MIIKLRLKESDKKRKCTQVFHVLTRAKRQDFLQFLLSRHVLEDIKFTRIQMKTLTDIIDKKQLDPHLPTKKPFPY